MYLSILISTWNNAEELRRTLCSIKECDKPSGLEWELIVVNNNCTDHSEKVLAEFRTLLPLRVLFEAKQGLSHGRNRALSEARGQWIIFTDDDVRPCKSWIKEYLRAFQKFPENYYFGGPIQSHFVGGSPDRELISVASAAIRGFEMNHQAPTIVNRAFGGANWAAPAAALSSVGKFDHTLGLSSSREMRFGEETDIQKRLKRQGLSAVYLPNAGIRHTIPKPKWQPDYILARAEALSFDKARRSEFRWSALVRATLSLCFYYSKYWLARRSAKKQYIKLHEARLRRGRFRGLFRNLADRCSTSKQTGSQNETSI